MEDVVYHCYPKQSRFGKTHPATRSFQALRIEVNEELKVLEQIIPDLFELLSKEGRMAFISFHSLEDRIVKRCFKKYHQEKIALATKKPILPSEDEILRNSRSRSAKLRVLERGDFHANKKKGKYS